ncbi:MAG: rhomboid family intramembrane serine protease [Desulfurococcales archaeon]|nr:rhomboid family intramembrane serine protease [Desulfurococcales archaeon]
MGIPIEDENIRMGRPIVNTVIILVNIIVFLVGNVKASLLYPGAETYEDLIYSLGMIPANIVAGIALSTIFTSMFLHADIIHLGGNMLYLFIFGDNVETVMGSLKYLIFYLLSGMGAVVFHIASIAYMPKDALLNYQLTTGVSPWMIPAIGASGAISGVLGAYMLLMPTARIRSIAFFGFIPLILTFPAYVYIGIWFLYQLIYGLATMYTGAIAGIAFWAHVGGFLTGMALTPIFIDRRKLRILRWFMAHRMIRY